MPVIDHDELRRIGRRVFAAGGSSEEEAGIIIDHLVEANLKGHDSHGVGMIPTYVKNVKAGLLHPNRHARLVSETGALAVFDGGMGYGQVIAREATEWGIAKAKETGLAAFAVRNTHHVARVGTYGELAARAGLVSIHFVNVLIAPGRVAPFGGVGGRFGTDPVCITFPGTATLPPVVLDFATSRIAAGKIRVALNQGKKLEPGTLIDHDGRDSTDPAVFFARDDKGGSMLPFGEHKGSGLALICELLGGALSGGKTLSGRLDGGRKVLNGMLSILIDPAKMGTGENLARETESFVAWHVASPPAEGVGHVKIAGEPEREWKRQRLAEGIPVDPTTWREIVASGAKVGLDKGAIEKLAS